MADFQGSTRLCVKNVPKHVTETRLKEHFSKKGDVTDCKILKTSDGRSRQMAFLGFKTEAQAKDAMKYFSKTYLDTSKLFVERATAIGAEDAPRAWSKHTKGSSAYELKHGKPAVTAPASWKKPAPLVIKADAKNAPNPQKTRLAPEDEDPALREFLEVMQPRQKTR
eukprot:CAMPEP_0198200972 /NCGR_PEP_ID=MMETSP1445-20131203/3831_1 /TAXON_ID=36898 /ORGANISM="Pyramimonas sp., Strain CCMP2087" /LENGTH=166 /DNA_ID=CAMNT_0043871145 /DNA_START=143 /DNA_END=640 /DNA_ORIENTATION=+